MSGEIDAPWARLELTSRPEAARLVRSMSTGVGEALAFDPELLSDVNTAVTEACNNVILHAYGGDPGPLSVELGASAMGVEVQVCDHGRGIRETASKHDGLKVGLALIGTLAERAEFTNVPGGGTELRMYFRSPTSGRPAGWPRTVQSHGGSFAWQGGLYSGITGDVVLTVSPVTLLGPVLGRIGRALAPTAGFSLQRCSDVYRLSDVLGAHVERAADSSSISVALDAHDQRLEFALAPLRTGSSAHLEVADLDGAADALARLSEEISFSALHGHETLRVSMRDPLRA